MPSHRIIIFVVFPALAAAVATLIAWLLSTVLPPPAAAVAASFIVNLALLLVFLALLPDGSEKATWPHLRRWGFGVMLAFSAHLGLWLFCARIEGPRVFVALAVMCAAQMEVLSACNVTLALIFGTDSRTPRTLCGIFLTLAVTALFWTRAPILNAGSPEASSHMISSTMYASPPAGVAAAWYSESEAALGKHGAGGRFDLVRAPMTYSVWVGSYQAVEYPVILPRWTDLRFEFGLAVLIFFFATPVFLICGYVATRKV